jgi:cysteine synthase B
MIEPTSGNTGIALAALCPTRQYKLTCVMPRNTSAERRELLEAYGVDIVWSPAEEGSNGSILLAQELVARDSDLVMLFQYGNPANPRVHYETTAPEILRDVPDVGAVVSGLGTGGTLTGTGRRLKEVNPEAKVFAAEPEYGELVYGLRSLEDGFVPPILDTTILDGRIKVQGDRAVAATQQLLTTTGIFAGVSTGAAIDVAIRMCSPRRLPKGTSVVIVSADGGWKYVSTGAYGADSPDLANSLWA